MGSEGEEEVDEARVVESTVIRSELENNKDGGVVGDLVVVRGACWLGIDGVTFIVGFVML